MIIAKKHFPEILPDNEQLYFDMLKGIIESVDELSSLQISKGETHYHFRLAPSVPKYNNLLIEELIRFHNMFKIRLSFSKSIKTSGTIVFTINLI